MTDFTNSKDLYLEYKFTDRSGKDVFDIYSVAIVHTDPADARDAIVGQVRLKPASAQVDWAEDEQS